jgi:hypothetical protein
VNRAVAFEVKGWCPGALTPMQSGDGLIVRVRPRCGMFSLDQLVVLADAARRFGNGHIDLTRRANLQIRGVGEENLPGLQDVIGTLGLLDPTPEQESVRNVMISPLAGIDPAEVFDISGIARQLDACGRARRHSSCRYPHRRNPGGRGRSRHVGRNRMAGLGLSRNRRCSCDGNRVRLPQGDVERDAATHAGPFR